jgi:hypothetical protein
LLDELEQRSRRLTAANSELRLTLEAGTDTAQALQGTLATIDRLAARYGELKPAHSTDRGERFDVHEYIALVRETDTAVRELNVLAQRIEQVLPQTASAARSATASISGFVDRVFLQLLALIVATFACAVIAALTYRAIASRDR